MGERNQTVMKWIQWIQRINETLLDLIAGCLVYSAVFEIIGLLIIRDRPAWTLGLILGTAAAVGMSVSMCRGIDNCLAMEPSAARRTMTIQSVLRLLVMLVVAWLGMRLPQISFPGVIVGILGLKASAHMHMYTNIYITKKIRRKGR